MVINPYQIHSTKSPQQNWVLCIQLPLPFLSEMTNKEFLHEYVFNANSCIEKSENDQELIATFASIISLQNKKAT
ncbi:hypothetical protein SDC49_24890 [Lactobacillus sp. R2/2]|nr:hypothetical protein [Lactobacillus sp. R2/2]